LPSLLSIFTHLQLLLYYRCHLLTKITVSIQCMGSIKDVRGGGMDELQKAAQIHLMDTEILKLKEELQKRDDKVLQLKEKLDELDDDVQRERRASSRMMKTLDETSRELEIVSVELQQTNIELQEEKKKNRELNALLLEQSQRPDATRRVYLQGRCWN
jgi:predicted nuclease with TOPRIM domain